MLPTSRKVGSGGRQRRLTCSRLSQLFTYAFYHAFKCDYIGRVGSNACVNVVETVCAFLQNDVVYHNSTLVTCALLVCAWLRREGWSWGLYKLPTHTFTCTCTSDNDNKIWFGNFLFPDNTEQENEYMRTSWRHAGAWLVLHLYITRSHFAITNLEVTLRQAYFFDVALQNIYWYVVVSCNERSPC